MIDGQLVTLRAMEPEDVDLLYNWENDQRLWQYGNTLLPISKADLKKFIEQSDLDIYQSKQIRLMIDTKDRKTVGCIDLFDFDPYHLHAYLGVMIEEQFRHSHYASDAVKTLINYAFNTLAIHTICATIASNNAESQALFLSCGFKKTGTRPNWLRLSSSFIDEDIFIKTKA